MTRLTDDSLPCSTSVETTGGAALIYPRTVADSFEAGRLVMTQIDDEREVATFDADRWIAAVCYGADGERLYVLRNQESR